MITKSDNEILNELIKANYNECKKRLTEVEDGLPKIYEHYKQVYPLRFIKHKKLKSWINFYKSLCLLPNEEEDLEMNKSNEIFEGTLSLKLGDKKHPECCILNIPFHINVTKLSFHILNIKHSDEKYVFVEDIITELGSEHLKKINNLSPKEYSEHTKARKSGRDYLRKVKEANPVIYTRGNNNIKENIINGNHRLFSAIENNNKVGGYIVDAEKCVQFGITDDYIKLYHSIINLDL